MWKPSQQALATMQPARPTPFQMLARRMCQPWRRVRLRMAPLAIETVGSGGGPGGLLWTWLPCGGREGWTRSSRSARAAHRAGALDREAFSAQALERLRPKPLRDMLEVDASDPIAVVGRSKAVDEATLRALSSIVSGPRSSPEERKRWPVSLAQDPIITATASGDRLVLRFRGEDDVKVWCWKMAHQVFANEGAGLLYTQNVSFEYPCAPTNLSRLFRYVSEGVVAADAGGTLVLAAADRNLAYPDAEYGFEGELLSKWVARTVGRLNGTERYATRDPPGFTSGEDDDLDTAFEKRWVSKAEEEDIDRAFVDDAPE